MPSEFVPELVALYEAGKLRLIDKIVQVYRVEDFNQAVSDMKAGKVSPLLKSGSGVA